MTTPPELQRQVASLPLAILLLAPGQKIASANPAAEQLLGQSARRLAGRPLLDVLGFDQPHMARRLGDSESPVSAREIGVTVGGLGTRRLDVTVAPVIDAPGWQMLTLHDSSAAEAMGEDAGGAGDALLRAPEVLAHEIKNPLAGIRGAAQLLGRKLGESDRALTRLIAEEVDRIAALIDRMQTLSRRTTAALEPCNLHEAVRRASAVLGAAQGNAARIEEEFDPSLPQVMGNGDVLVQVLINLLANAREACDSAAQPRVAVRTRFASGLQLHSTLGGKPLRLPIELRVSDNGPGVDPAMRDRIFDPWVTTKTTGQGLGLALVRKLVGEMNGRISYERDETGGWTHFRLHMPLASEDRQPGHKGAQAA